MNDLLIMNDSFVVTPLMRKFASIGKQNQRQEDQC